MMSPFFLHIIPDYKKTSRRSMTLRRKPSHLILPREWYHFSIFMILSPPRNFETRVETVWYDARTYGRCRKEIPLRIYWSRPILAVLGRLSSRERVFFRVKFKSKGQYQHGKRNRPRHCLVRTSQISLVIVNATKKWKFILWFDESAHFFDELKLIMTRVF